MQIGIVVGWDVVVWTRECNPNDAQPAMQRTGSSVRELPYVDLPTPWQY